MAIQKRTWITLTRRNLDEVRNALRAKIEAEDGNECNPLSEEHGSVIGSEVRFTENTNGESVVFFEYSDAACMIVNGKVEWGESEVVAAGWWKFTAASGIFDEDGDRIGEDGEDD